jgi:hypothetical protein
MSTIANIGPRGRRERLRLGIAVLLAALAVAAVMVLWLPARGPRAFLMLPLWVAGLGVFQARAKT